MKFTLTRDECGRFGQLGVLVDEAGDIVAHTMEHAYACLDDFAPKIPAGVYTCRLGTHQLHTTGPFQAYELQDVPGHSNILIHFGNTENDSEGCILVGDSVGEVKGLPAVLNSRKTFDAFMVRCDGAATITLEVVG